MSRSARKYAGESVQENEREQVVAMASWLAVAALMPAAMAVAVKPLYIYGIHDPSGAGSTVLWDTLRIQ